MPPPADEEYAEAAAARRSTVWRYVVLLVLLLVALGVVLVLLGRQLGLVASDSSGAPVLAPPPPTVPITVPADLIGKTFTDAANEVQALGMRYARSDVDDTQHPENTVVNTSPAAGTQIAGSGVITLEVSSGPLPITEPDVVGLDLQTATKQLQQAGFTVGPPQQQVNAYVPSGLIVSTVPPPGSQAHNGDTVSIIVSAPKTTIADPRRRRRQPAAGRRRARTSRLPGQGLEPGGLGEGAGRRRGQHRPAGWHQLPPGQLRRVRHLVGAVPGSGPVRALLRRAACRIGARGPWPGRRRNALPDEQPVEQRRCHRRITDSRHAGRVRLDRHVDDRAVRDADDEAEPAQEVVEQPGALDGEDRLRVELHALDRAARGGAAP